MYLLKMLLYLNYCTTVCILRIPGKESCDTVRLQTFLNFGVLVSFQALVVSPCGIFFIFNRIVTVF